MNNLTSRKLCAAAKVFGCIPGLPLAVAGVIMVPYFSIIIGFAIILLLLCLFEKNLPKSLFEICIVAAAGWIIPSLCGLIYWLMLIGRLDNSSAPTFILNIISILLTAVFIGLIILARGIVLDTFNYFLKGCTDQKSSDNGAR